MNRLDATTGVINFQYRLFITIEDIDFLYKFLIRLIYNRNSKFKVRSNHTNITNYFIARFLLKNGYQRIHFSQKMKTTQAYTEKVIEGEMG